MTALKSTEKVAEIIDKILEALPKELEDLQGKITEQDEIIAAAERQMTEATTAGDPAAYHKAKDLRRGAEDVKEMYCIRRDNLRDRPLMPEPDYMAAVEEVTAGVKDLEMKTRARLKGLSDEMNAAALELDYATREANKVLRKLQHDIYRDADRSRSRDGSIMMISHEAREVSTTDTVNWGRSGSGHYAYADYTGQKIPRN